jgi:hypothetical protein
MRWLQVYVGGSSDQALVCNTTMTGVCRWQWALSRKVSSSKTRGDFAAAGMLHTQLQHTARLAAGGDWGICMAWLSHAAHVVRWLPEVGVVWTVRGVSGTIATGGLPTMAVWPDTP